MLKNMRFNISFKISLLVIGIGVLVVVSLGSSFYLATIEGIEDHLGEKLEHVAKTASLLIDEDDHIEILSLYLKQSDKIYESEAFLRTQKALRRVKEINNLTTELYTVILPKWADGKMIFVSMSDEEPSTGNASPSTRIIREVFKTGKPSHSKLYITEEGQWVSGVAPLINKKGVVFAALEIDYRADAEVELARNNFLKSIVKLSSIIIFCLLVGGVLLGRFLARPIKELSRLALDVAKGNLDAQSDVERNDEVGVLASSLNFMTRELKAKNRVIKDNVLNLEKTVVERTEKLHFEKVFIEKVLQSMQDMLIVLSNTGVITSVNEIVVQKLNIPEEQIVGRNIRDYIDKNEVEKIANLGLEDGDYFETLIKGKIDEEIPVLVTRSRMELEQEGKKDFIIYTMKDLTKRKNAELKIAAQKAIVDQSSRLASLGEVSSGIAHEINNPVTIIDGQLRRLKDYIEDEDILENEEIGLIDKIQKNLNRVVKIVNGLRRISRNTDGDPFEIRTTAFVANELLELYSEKYKNTDVVLDISQLKGDTSISIKESDIIQVLLNLVSNAYDAIFEREGSKWIKIEEEVTDDTIILRVMDSGDGVPRENVEKLFQPFFTTKDVGQGTGIGLSIAKKIMEEHRGDLFYDIQFKHSCFVLIFPKIA